MKDVQDLACKQCGGLVKHISVGIMECRNHGRLSVADVKFVARATERVPSERAASCECHGIPKCPSRGPARTVARLMEDTMKIAKMDDVDAGTQLVRLTAENAALQARLDAPVPEVEAVALRPFDFVKVAGRETQCVPADLARDLARRLVEARREKSVTELTADNPNLAQYIAQVERQLAEARAKERERWDLYCLRRAAEYCYDVPVECNTPETQDARDRTRAAIHKRILELLGERSALTDEAKP